MKTTRIAASSLLLISAIVTVLLVIQHFTAAALPGCGPGSACAAAASSAWGRVPGTAIPVSFIGLAYYISMLVAYLAYRGNIGSLIWIVRLAVVASLMFTGVMLANIGEYLCMYCLIGHVAHVGFWTIVEFLDRPAANAAPSRLFTNAFATWIAGFIIVSAVLVAGNALQKGELMRAAEGGLAETERQLAEGAGDERGFTGRYVRGREDAPIRFVVFTDYQCPDCKRFETAIEEVLAERDDVSLSIKHYPLNSQCNRHITVAMHPNACNAARAAEAAGILGGEDAFWKMHDWLFERGGAFTPAEVRQFAAAELGFNEREFIDAMEGLDTRSRIMTDIDEAQSVGILGTPLIFVNGVELRGWHLPDALPRAIAAATQRTAEDRPPPAYQKYIDDWRHAMPAELGEMTQTRAIGASEPRVVVDVWGDYLNEHVAECDAALRAIMARRNDIRYRFRFFPMDRHCNPAIQQTMHQHACLAALAAEVAARHGDGEQYAALHRWLIENRTRFTMESLPEAADIIGLPLDGLLLQMRNDELAQAILGDISDAQRLRIRQIPMIYVNNKLVPRWQLEGHDILRTIIEEAAKE